MESEKFDKHDFKELQLVPAAGWRAVYLNPETNAVKTRPVICFALVKHIDSGDTFIDGMTPAFEDRAYIQPAGALDESCDFVFVGFIGTGETPEDAINDFQESLKRQLEKEEGEPE